MAKTKKQRQKPKSGKVDPRYFLKRMRRHFSADPAQLELVTLELPPYHRPNVHLAIESVRQMPGVQTSLDGIISHEYFEDASLARLSRDSTARHYLPGPVEYQDVDIADGKRLSCVKRGLFWLDIKGSPVVMLVDRERHSFPQQIKIEMMARNRDEVEDFSRLLTRRIQNAPAFRGHVMALEVDCHRQLVVQFRRLPTVRRDEIVLPDDVLRRLDRQTIGMVRHSEKLRSSGRHMKRGLLLHGPPGTGKTLSAMYIASLMPGRTVLIITGGGIDAIETSGILARSLAPVTIILEDVDLIGTQREHQTVGANALLFELLNQMDGLNEDADVLFILTTNRADVLEPALAARPGRIDQAIEVPLPDVECRRRLVELYSRGLDLQVSSPDGLAERTAGVSGAFIRELFRRAAILSLENANCNGRAVLVTDVEIDAAMEELTVAGGRLTQRLLGIKPT